MTTQADIIKMDLVCTVQLVNHKIDPAYIGTHDFKRLWRMTADQLEAERDRLIPIYNQIIKDRQD